MGKRRMGKTKGYRLVLIIAATVIGLLAVIWLAAPMWFPWLLRPLARTQGARFGEYERLGYSRLALNDLVFTNSSLRVSADRVETLVPTVWLWRSGTGGSMDATVEGWNVETLPTQSKDEGPPVSTFTNIHQVLSTLSTVDQWLSQAVLSNGTVQVSGTTVSVPLVRWNGSVVQTTVKLPSSQHGATLSADFSRTPYQIQLEAPSFNLAASLRVTTNAETVAIEATGLWLSNQFTAEAQFRRSGVLPATAQLRAPTVRVPSSLLELPKYEQLEGGLSARWDQGKFTLKANAQAEPQSTSTNLPPVQLAIQARGDTNSAVLDTLEATSPWVNASLSDPVDIHFSGKMIRAPAQLKLAADLTQQHWVELQGQVQGRVEIEPGPGKYPTARFQLTGEGVGNQEIGTKTVEMRGALDWPTLQLTTAEAVFDDGFRAQLRGAFNLQSNTISGGHIELAGPLPGQWLPETYSFESIQLAADVNGPLRALNHRGRAEVVHFSGPNLRPSDVQVTWTGALPTRGEVQVTVTNEQARLQVAGTLQATKTATNLSLKTLTLSESGEMKLSLQSSAHFSVGLGTKTKLGPHLGVRVENLHWAGPAGELKLRGGVEWPEAGAVVAEVNGLHSDLLSGFLTSNVPLVKLNHLRAAAHWTNGPLRAELELSAAALTNFPISAKARLLTTEAGVSIQELTVSDRGEPVVVGQGLLPLQVVPGAKEGWVQLESEKPLNLRLSTDLQGNALQRIEELVGIQVSNPEVEANVSGTWAKPFGRIQVSAKQLQLPKKEGKLPEVTDLQLALTLDREMARLSEGVVHIQGQPLTFTAGLPLGSNFWQNLTAMDFPDLRQATGRVQVAEAKLAAWAELYPEILAPQGTISADLSVRSGLNLNGFLRITDARSRPLPTLGPLRSINVEVRVDNNQLQLKDSSVDVGGATVNLTGQADMSGTNWMQSKELPPFTVALRGTNVPLTRQPEVVIRSDLGLIVTKTNGAPPIVGGSVLLRDSFLLSDLGDLIPGGVAGPKRRPPYFSIDTPFLADWRLGVAVGGERFLRVRSPLFTGEVSANLNLQGTLKEPVALGTIQVDSGLVRFPFGSLEVQQGLITITSENPYQPQLSISAESKQFGFDIRMEVSGTAQSPVIQFSSTPPLASEQILLLLTAGEIPGGEYTLSAKQRAQTLAMFLGRELLAKLGFGGSAEPRLVIRSGEEISESGRPTYRIEFRLTEDWSLVAEYDRFGDFNMGAKWRFYTK